MSGNTINFRTAKKRVKATRKDAQAAENRVKFGRTKAQKQADETASAKAKRHVDGHKRDTDET
ncbi:MAG: DUF4169 family protein [Alphaproteobacteria bacterium]